MNYRQKGLIHGFNSDIIPLDGKQPPKRVKPLFKQQTYRLVNELSLEGFTVLMVNLSFGPWTTIQTSRVIVQAVNLSFGWQFCHKIGCAILQIFPLPSPLSWKAPGVSIHRFTACYMLLTNGYQLHSEFFCKSYHLVLSPSSCTHRLLIVWFVYRLLRLASNPSLYASMRCSYLWQPNPIIYTPWLAVPNGENLLQTAVGPRTPTCLHSLFQWWFVSSTLNSCRNNLCE